MKLSVLNNRRLEASPPLTSSCLSLHTVMQTINGTNLFNLHPACSSSCGLLIILSEPIRTEERRGHGDITNTTWKAFVHLQKCFPSVSGVMTSDRPGDTSANIRLSERRLVVSSRSGVWWMKLSEPPHTFISLPQFKERECFLVLFKHLIGGEVSL